MNKNIFIFLYLFLFTLTTWAENKEFYEFTVGHWSGAAYEDENTGQFSHCDVSGWYGENEFLVLAINYDNSFRLSVGNTAWGLEVGDKYIVQIYIDDYYLGKYKSSAPDPNFISIQFGIDNKIKNAFKHGNILTVRDSQADRKYRLTGTNNAINELERCVNLSLAFSGGRKNPFAENKTNPFSRLGMAPSL